MPIASCRRAPRPPVPRTRPASDSFEAVHTGTGDLLSSCDLVASMQNCKRTDRRANMADDASCAFELGRNAMAFTCMHASVRVQAIAGIETAGLLGT